jgi:capsular exopolysaccharide synthesis family protein
MRTQIANEAFLTGTPRAERESRSASSPATNEELELVHRLSSLAGVTAARVVVFAGVEHGNGCTTVCSRLAQVLAAQVPGNVCLVDANLRSPSLHNLSDGKNLRGLTEALVEKGEIRSYVRPSRTENLWLLTSGFHVSNLDTLLSSESLHRRLAELRVEFEYVLLDAPPLNFYSDAKLLGQLADGLVMVLEANSTKRETARKCKETLESARVKILGAVLNKRTFPIPDFVYSKL